jgi:hypothetical protein
VSNPYAPPDPNKPRPPRPLPPPAQERAGLRPGQPSRPPQPRPEPPKLTPEQARSVSSAVLVFGLLMLCSLLASDLPVPWQVVAPFVGIAALVYGTRLLIRVRTLRWPGLLTPMLVGGLVLTGLTTMTTTTQLTMFWDEQVAYQQCRERAITIAAQERCDREWEQARNPSQS